MLLGDEPLSRAGLRLIAPDRPGMGMSDFKHGRGFSDWPRDVVFLADSLGLQRFALLGNSGGGPYVAACAAAIPERVTSAVIVSGAWRMDAPEVAANLPFVNRIFWILACRFPLGLQFLLSTMRRPGKSSRDTEFEKDAGTSSRRRFCDAIGARPFGRGTTFYPGMLADGHERRSVGHRAICPLV
jgi:pimeloyl-ACP methyl ester carboxylesterase